MDTGDIEGVVALFTPDGVIKDVTGKCWDAAAGGVRGFATHFLTRPNRRGGQHHVQHLLVEPANGGGYRVTSYWVSIQWDAEGDRKFIRAMGSYAGHLRQGGWPMAHQGKDHRPLEQRHRPHGRSPAVDHTCPPHHDHGSGMAGLSQASSKVQPGPGAGHRQDVLDKAADAGEHH